VTDFLATATAELTTLKRDRHPALWDISCACLVDRRGNECSFMVDPVLMEIQLRDYRIRHGQMDAWIAGWKSHVVPLREEAGFQLIGAWLDAQDDRFVWLLGYSGAEGFQAADDRYYASRKRRDLRPDPSELIEGATQTMVVPVM
jgi:hypothetical protein